MQIKIKENSLLAKIAARKLKADRMALVLGKKILLYNVTRENFLKNERWVRHEVAHVLQYKKKGFFRFLISYTLHSLYFGYHDNLYEVEAREMELDAAIMHNVSFKEKR